MATIIEKLNAHSDDLFTGKGASPAQIAEAEAALGVQFAEDYKQCLLKFGVIAFDGHELTGITSVPRINVVEETERLRVNNPEISHNWYAIEEANIDRITIWQDTSGKVYGSIPRNKPIKLANNLAEYLEI